MTQSLIIKYRRPLIILLHALIAALCFAAAYLIRFESLDSNYLEMALKVWPLAVAVKLIAIWRYRLFSGLWKYIGTNELVRLFKALTISSAALVAIVILWLGHGFPRAVFIIDYLLALVLMGGIRAFNRVYREDLRNIIRKESPKRTIILGAGHTGDVALRMLQTQQEKPHKIVAFLDDDPSKQGLRMHDVPVLGPLSDLSSVVREFEATDVVFAIPGISKQIIATLVAHCSQQDLDFHIMPTFRDAASGQVLFQDLRNIQIDDLLGRDPIAMEHEDVAKDLHGKTVMITGAGGSIGSELARQVAACHPLRLILFEFAENPLFYIQQEILKEFPDVDLVSVVGDIKQRDALENTFREYKPEIVYHAAAYKHVPLMEDHPVEAVLNNVYGTYYLARAAVKYDVKRFVMISTDKAVRPTNVMGATKRYSELVLTSLPSENTTFIGVRFGNVLGSNGSVIPTFRQQIAEGGPITVTHPDITRYFITIEEAVGLVLEAGLIGKCGNVFVLDMGEPVKITDLAKSMVELAGLRPGEDIEIQFTGLRPGEKLYEELVAHNEDLVPTAVPKLMLLKRRSDQKVPEEELQEELKWLRKAACERNSEETRQRLWQLVRKHDPDA